MHGNKNGEKVTYDENCDHDTLVDGGKTGQMANRAVEKLVDPNTDRRNNEEQR